MVSRSTVDVLRASLDPARLARVQAALDGRTRDLVVLLEHVEDAHNLSAVFRSADAFGVQEVHVIDRTQDFAVSSRITQGCHKWLEGGVWAEPGEAVAALRGRGFRLLAAVCSPDAVPLEDLDLSGRVALAFGNEKGGLTDDLVRACDGTFTIPMRGFTRSLNVSVTAAVGLAHARHARDWPGLTPAQRDRLETRWLRLATNQSTRLAEALDLDADVSWPGPRCRRHEEGDE